VKIGLSGQSWTFCVVTRLDSVLTIHTSSPFVYEWMSAIVLSDIAFLSAHLEIRHAEALAKKAKSVRISSGAGSANGGLKRVY
jgi:hypothetical protein